MKRFFALAIFLCAMMLALAGCYKTNGNGSADTAPGSQGESQEPGGSGLQGDSQGSGTSGSQGDNTAPGTSLPALSDPLTASNFLLNTIVSVTLYDRGTEETLQACFDICREYEQKLSRTVESSEISRLNQATEFPFTVSEDTAALLGRALYFSELSGGAFDLAVAPLTSIWDFTSAEPVKPSDEAISEAIRHIDYQNVRIDGCDVFFSDPATAVDLGAIAKGYIADRIKDYLVSQGVGSAIINLGGNVLCVGSKPDGSGFRIGLQKPFENRNETISIVEIHGRSVVSSGIYERYFKQDGVLYHHILNPDTGYPYETDLIAVTIISDTSVDGDGLSTTCFALGLEKGLELINSLPDVDAVFITDDYVLHYSEDFAEHVTILED